MQNQTIVVRKDVPLPESNRNGRAKKCQLRIIMENMEIGDSFIHPDEYAKGMAATNSHLTTLRNTHKFSRRKINEDGIDRCGVWRIA